MLNWWIPSLVASQNYSLSFSTGQYVRIPVDSSLHGFTTFTVECWFYELNSQGQEHLVGGEYFGCPLFRLGYESGGSISGYISDCDTFAVYNGQSIQNQWVHIAMTYDGNNFRYFIDGVMVDSQTISLSNFGAGDQDIVINRHTWDTGSSSRLTGYLDELRISNKCRYFNDFTPSICEFSSDEFTMGLWHFNEANGSQVFDESGNGNHGSMINGTGWSTNTPMQSCIDSSNISGLTIDKHNLFLNNSGINGIIMMDQNGSCWKMTVDTLGVIQTHEVLCPD